MTSVNKQWSLKLDILKAKDYFKLGVLTGATVHAASLMHPHGWTIEFSGKLGDSSALFETMRGEVRQFKTLDSAAKVLTEVGFKKWGVQL